METNYITCADTAKIIRKALKENFPSIKFSVRSSTYSMGASIRIHWTDGPLTEAVDKVVGKFEGASFDGMIDLKSSVYTEYEGKRTKFGSDYIFTNREITDHDVWKQLFTEKMKATCKLDYSTPGHPKFGNEWVDHIAGRMVHFLDYSIKNADERIEKAYRVGLRLDS